MSCLGLSPGHSFVVFWPVLRLSSHHYLLPENDASSAKAENHAASFLLVPGTVCFLLGFLSPDLGDRAA